MKRLDVANKTLWLKSTDPSLKTYSEEVAVVFFSLNFISYIKKNSLQTFDEKGRHKSSICHKNNIDSRLDLRILSSKSELSLSEFSKEAEP